MARTLQIADDYALPLEAVTQTFAIVARRGAGKTYTALKLAEEMLAAGQQVVIIDPVGACWGLRASADGRGPGLPIYVLGGEHPDAPLAADAGKIVAELVSRERLPAVLDLSLLQKAEMNRFVCAFAERLYHIQREALHLVIDEADAFAPQRPMPGEQRMLGALEDLVRRGRKRGIGVSLITQRPAVLNKNVLTQAEVLITLQLSHPRDLKAVEEWVKLHATDEQHKQFMATVPTLQRGQAWFWSPSWLGVFRRIQVARRTTFDSSATPKAGERPRAAPKQLASVDLTKLRETLSAQIKQAEAEDPRKLRARIAELEKQLAAAGKQADPAQLERAIAQAKAGWERDEKATRAALRRHLAQLMERLSVFGKLGAQADDLVTRVAADLEGGSSVTPERTVQRQPPPVPKTSADYAQKYRRPAQTGEADAGGGKLAKAERAILTALAQHGGRSKVKVAVLTGYSHNGGGFNNAVSKLRTLGYVVGSGDLEISDAGRQALGDVDPLPSGPDLVAYWYRQLGKAERLILEQLVAAYPQSLTKADVAANTGYEANGGGFNNACSRLRSLELIERTGGELRASDQFFE